MISKTKFLFLIILISHYNYSQTAPFEIALAPLDIIGLGGIQSYAFGQYNDKWLLVGGRLDGLHQRQPGAAFDSAGHNNQFIVVDPVTQQKWSAPLTALSIPIQEQLSATNMEFYQEGDYLYCIGGYGYSSSIGDYTTFSSLTAIKVPELISAIITNSTFSAYFRQITDAKFQVTGGRLKKIDNSYYLLGGQKFIGRYNPMGPNNGPGFIQEYTNAIRRFSLSDNGSTINSTHLPSFVDDLNLHRRDYNAVSQILPNGNEGITMFSGVFQKITNLPFLNSVTVDTNGYNVNNSFQQFYNHYHCPTIPLYSEIDNEMHTVFFGGIAQFYDSNGILVQDNNVPFVPTIARIIRDSNGTLAEYKLPIEMPTLLGAGAEFIPSRNFPHFTNEIFKLDDLTTNNTLIGYIYGGISSTQPNIFFINDGTQSDASSKIFKVFIKKTVPLYVDEFNPSSTSTLNLFLFPNPTDGVLNLSFYLSKKEDVTISIFDMAAALLSKTVLKHLNEGENQYRKELSNLTNGAIYLITIETSTEKATRKLILSK
jgi:hypothetical protein